MSDFLERLGRAAREDERLGERIDEAAEGALAGRLPDPELGLDAEALREAYRPLSADAKAAIAARIAGIVARPAAASPAPTELRSPPTELRSAPTELRSAPTELRSAPAAHPSARRTARSRWALGVVPALGMAAALLLWLSSGERPPTAASAALAPYRLEVQGSVAAERGAPSIERGAPNIEHGAPSTEHPGTLALATGTPVVLLLRPERASGGGVAVHAYLRAQGVLAPLAHRMEAAPSGTVRLQIAAETRWPERGEIVVWLGAANLEPQPEQLAAGAPALGPGWQRLERAFERVP